MVWWKRKKPEPPQKAPESEGITRRELLKGAYSSAVAAVLFGSGAAAVGCDAADPRAPAGKRGDGYSDFAAYGYGDALGYHDSAYADAAYDDSYDDGYDDGAVAYGDGYDDGYSDGYSDSGGTYYDSGGYSEYSYSDSGYSEYSYSEYADAYSEYSEYSEYARPHGSPRHRHHPRR